MFGYVTAYQPGLTEEQFNRYREVYCGLCRSIGQRHGQAARMCLTYDMTFLVLLLDSMEEPEQRMGKRPCLLHPFSGSGWRQSRWTEYCADMNVALAYHNCLDDWKDNKSLLKLGYAQTLRGAYERIRRQWPEQCALIETSLAELSRFEEENSSDLDGAAACFGRLMAGLLAPAPNSFFRETLREVGDRLGRFIYVMDAVLDQEEDQKQGHYNPVTTFEVQHGSLEPRSALEVLMGECTLAFEKLPLEQDLDLLRNILYSGVWSRWNEKKNDQSEEKTDE